MFNRIYMFNEIKSKKKNPSHFNDTYLSLVCTKSLLQKEKILPVKYDTEINDISSPFIPAGWVSASDAVLLVQLATPHLKPAIFLF